MTDNIKKTVVIILIYHRRKPIDLIESSILVYLHQQSIRVKFHDTRSISWNFERETHAHNKCSLIFNLGNGSWLKLFALSVPQCVSEVARKHCMLGMAGVLLLSTFKRKSHAISYSFFKISTK
jgi:hypothetical protein